MSEYICSTVLSDFLTFQYYSLNVFILKAFKLHTSNYVICNVF